MEFLNKIEVRGVVGRADHNTYNGMRVSNFSVVTEASVKDKENGSVIEPTWFNVSAWDGVKGGEDFARVKKGDWVHVTGRLRLRKYTNQEQEERSSLDIQARLVEILSREGEEDPTMQPQRD